jgi:hypothetical protein
MNKTRKLMAYFDTDTDYKNIIVTEVSLKNDQLSLKIPISVSGGCIFTGRLSNNSISGIWKQPGFENEISFSRKIQGANKQ